MPKLYTFQLVHSEATSCRGDVTIHANHPLFEGHFPGTPILPGVCYLRIQKSLLESAISRNISFKSASQIKFLTPVLVHETTRFWVESSWEINHSILKVSTVAKNENVVFCKLKSTYAID